LLEKFSFKRLSLVLEPKPLDCGDADLNDFFFNDANKYEKQLLSVTYVFESDRETAAFFSVSNDKIVNKDPLTKRIVSNILARKIPNDKRRPTYPAVKIGRLGIHKQYQRQGMGSEVLSFIKAFFTTKNKTGCRFITVDAYNCQEVLSFYKKNGFKYLTGKDEKDKTRLMYFDLITFVRE